MKYDRSDIGYLNESLMRILYIIIVLSTGNNIFCQDIHFSQLSQTQMYSNPAFTGIQFGPRLMTQYRNQYPQVGNDVNAGIRTLYASYDQYIEDYRSGFGLQIMADKMSQSLLSRYYISPTYSYQVNLSQYHALRLGALAQIVVQQVDASQLRFYDQIDPINGTRDYIPTQEDLSNINSSTYFNTSLGALYFRHNFYLGASVRNILPKGNSNSQNPNNFEDILYSGQTGAVLWLNEDKRIGIFPLALYEYQYKNHKIVGNILYQYEMINAGLGFRHNSKSFESIMMMVGLNFNKFRISYSYDIPSNTLSSYSGGSHELGIRYLIKGEDNTLRPNYYKNILFCPDFIKN